jgi:DNA-binding NtrC family response regulator
MKSFNKILIIDDDRDVLLAARLFLKQHAKRVDTEANPNLIPTLLQNDTYDVILLDMNFPQDATSGKEGFHWLGRILEIDASAVVILITAYGGVETAVQAIKEGATDFVLKPWQNEKLLATLSSASKLRRSQLEVGKLRAQYYLLCHINHSRCRGTVPNLGAYALRRTHRPRPHPIPSSHSLRRLLAILHWHWIRIDLQ